MELTGPVARKWTTLDKIERNITSAMEAAAAAMPEIRRGSAAGPAAAMMGDLRRAEQLCRELRAESGKEVGDEWQVFERAIAAIAQARPAA